jgi:hypothetical protein
MKSFNQFNESKNSIESICKEYGIRDYTINPDGSVDVHDSVSCGLKFGSRLGPGIFPVKFGKINGKFDCSNDTLTSLENGPEEVNGYFDCSYNKLTSFKGLSLKKVRGDFYCDHNELTSLVGCADIIGGDLYCSNNKITDFRGVPEFFEGNLYCVKNPIFEIYSLFPNWQTNSSCIKWINEFDVIQDNTIVLDRLEEVFHQLGKVVPQNITFKSYKII